MRKSRAKFTKRGKKFKLQRREEMQGKRWCTHLSLQDIASQRRRLDQQLLQFFLISNLCLFIFTFGKILDYIIFMFNPQFMRKISLGWNYWITFWIFCKWLWFNSKYIYYFIRMVFIHMHAYPRHSWMCVCVLDLIFERIILSWIAFEWYKKYSNDIRNNSRHRSCDLYRGHISGLVLEFYRRIMPRENVTRRFVQMYKVVIKY